MRKVVTGFAAFVLVAIFATALIAGEEKAIEPVASNFYAPQSASCSGPRISVLRKAPLRSLFANCRAKRAARQASRASCAGTKKIEVVQEVLVVPRRTLRVLNCNNGQCQ